MTKTRVKKTVINKQFVINIIFAILIFCLGVLFLVQNVNSEKEEIKGIKNPYDIEVSSFDNFVLLGDSITEWYPIDEFYDDLPVVNSGVAGYKTKDILDNLKKMVFIYNPTKVFLLIGTNDIKEDPNEKEVVSNIQKIISEIQRLRPKAKVYLQSIYPVNNGDDEKVNKNTVGDRSNDVIKSINKKLEKHYRNTDVTYIDVYSELANKEGNLDLKYTEDGLHLSNLGYLRVTKTLLPYFQD